MTLDTFFRTTDISKKDNTIDNKNTFFGSLDLLSDRTIIGYINKRDNEVRTYVVVSTEKIVSDGATSYASKALNWHESQSKARGPARYNPDNVTLIHDLTDEEL